MRGWARAGPWALPGGALLLLAAGTPAAGPQFTDITRETGIDFKHDNSPTSNKYLLETMGGGVALLDYDNDGRLDVFFTSGAKLAAPTALIQRTDKSSRRHWQRLYHRNSHGVFENANRHTEPTHIA